MGIYDRDYYRNPGGNAQLKSWASTAVGTIILLNVGFWFLQLIPRPGPGARPWPMCAWTQGAQGLGLGA